MSFDLNLSEVLRYANNFFTSAYPIATIIIGVAIGGWILHTLISLIRRAG